jgi:hypothetical protein
MLNIRKKKKSNPKHVDSDLDFFGAAIVIISILVCLFFLVLEYIKE